MSSFNEAQVEKPVENLIEISIEELVQAFNSKVISVYNQYSNPDGSSTLVNPDLPGYANIIYHFFSTGAITYLSGGKDYGKTEEKYGERELSNSRRLGFEFVKAHKSLNATYVILPVEKCIELRKEMEQIIQIARSSDYLKPLNIEQMIRELNTEVINASKAHYPPDQYENTYYCSLIKRDEAPNANTIYMLDSRGKIEFTKGGNVFGSRSYFTDLNGDELSMGGIRFRFSEKMIDNIGNSYVILTHEECRKFRLQMHKLILLIENSK